MSKGKEIIIPAKKGEGGICFGPYALIENLVCGVPRSAIKTKMKGVKAKWKVETEGTHFWNPTVLCWIVRAAGEEEEEEGGGERCLI